MSNESSTGFVFADRIAEVTTGTRREGYLHVTVPEIAESSRRGGITYVDMVFARRDYDEPGGWRYEDRADPGTESAQEELEAGQLEWYGEKFELRWLDEDTSERVLADVFHDGNERA